MTTMIPSKSADCHLEPSAIILPTSANAGSATAGSAAVPKMTHSPLRKTISLSSIFREKRRSRSSSLLPNDEPERRPQGEKRKKKPSQLSFSPLSSPTRTTFSPSPQSQQPDSPSSSSFSSPKGRWHGRLSRVVPFSQFASSSSPSPSTFSSSSSPSSGLPIPSRPTCPAPLLDLSFFEGIDDYAALPHHKFDPKALSCLQNLTIAAAAAGTGAQQISSMSASHDAIPIPRSPSQESFQCRGPELATSDDSGNGASKLPHAGASVSPPFVRLMGGAAVTTTPMLSRPVSTISLDTLNTLSSVASSSAASCVWSDTYSTRSSSHSPVAGHPGLTSPFQCPPSPPPQLHLVLLMPKSKDAGDQASRRTEMAASSTDSVLELKEKISVRLDCSPRSLALILAGSSSSDFGLSTPVTENRRLLDNDRALYEEGLQDDDEIIVELLSPSLRARCASASTCYARSFF